MKRKTKPAEAPVQLGNDIVDRHRRALRRPVRERKSYLIGQKRINVLSYVPAFLLQTTLRPELVSCGLYRLQKAS